MVHSNGEVRNSRGLKRELNDEQEAANQRLVKRLKLDKVPIFKPTRNSSCLTKMWEAN